MNTITQISKQIQNWYARVFININPIKDWRNILIVFIALNVVSIVLAASSFLNYKEIVRPTDTVALAELNRADHIDPVSLRATLELYRTRSLEFGKDKRGSLGLVDPSI